MAKKVEKKKKDPTKRQQLLARVIAENIRNKKPVIMQDAMEEAGYSPSYAASSTRLKETKSWNELLDAAFPDDEVLKVHKGLMNSTRVDHQVYPLETPELTDAHIVELLAAVNCTVKKIVHGDTSRHVYYWVANDKARKEALDMLYKLKTRYDNTVTIKGKLGSVSDEEIEDRIAGALSGIIGALAGEGAPDQE